MVGNDVYEVREGAVMAKQKTVKIRTDVLNRVRSTGWVLEYSWAAIVCGATVKSRRDDYGTSAAARRNGNDWAKHMDLTPEWQ